MKYFAARGFKQLRFGETLPEVCPDCKQKLSEPQRPMDHFFGHPVFCAMCEDCRPKPKEERK